MIKDFLLSLFLPPTCFLYLALLGWLASPRYRVGRLATGVGIGCLAIFSLPVVSGTLMAGLESGLPRTPPPEAMPRAIVILGGDVERTTEPPFALPGEHTLKRLRTGVELWRRTKLPVLVTGGIIFNDRAPVATIMADSLRADFQVPVAWVEDASPTTWENAILSAEILKKQGINSVYVVTNGWHLRRAVIAFRRAGLTVTAVPTSMSAPLYFKPASYFPSSRAWANSYFAMHEWIGCAWYQLR